MTKIDYIYKYISNNESESANFELIVKDIVDNDRASYNKYAERITNFSQNGNYCYVLDLIFSLMFPAASPIAKKFWYGLAQYISTDSNQTSLEESYYNYMQSVATEKQMDGKTLMSYIYQETGLGDVVDELMCITQDTPISIEKAMSFQYFQKILKGLKSSFDTNPSLKILLYYDFFFIRFDTGVLKLVRLLSAFLNRWTISQVELGVIKSFLEELLLYSAEHKIETKKSWIVETGSSETNKELSKEITWQVNNHKFAQGKKKDFTSWNELVSGGKDRAQEILRKIEDVINQSGPDTIAYIFCAMCENGLLKKNARYTTFLSTLKYKLDLNISSSKGKNIVTDIRDKGLSKKKRMLYNRIQDEVNNWQIY